MVEFEHTLNTLLRLKCGENRSFPKGITSGLYFENSSGIYELRCSSQLCFGLNHHDESETRVFLHYG